ncbi:MAG: hypothetical protein LBH51_08150 [Treponema sp.]|nr:hypothetical protein [Treponema sp.]
MILIVLGILMLALAFFLGRPPVLILGDAGFDAFYGRRRIFLRQAGLSLRFFRQVKRVSIAENANPEAAVFAIEEKSALPWAVLGHSRYLRGLEQYARQHPEITVAVIQEGPAPRAGTFDAEEGPEAVFTDIHLNSWRAGRCAALLAGEEGEILVFQDERNYPVNRESFLAGLREENEALIPVYVDSSVDYPSWDRVRCVVLGAAADSYFDRNSAIPALLFTWMDPALCPSVVKISVDDSPWALAPEILGLPGGEDSGGYRIVPAKFTLLGGRVGEGELKKGLKKTLDLQISASLPR